MASAPTRRCPRCRQLTQGGCITCRRASQRQYDKQRERDPFLDSPAWRKLRKAYKAEHPLCERCEARGRITPTAEIHHKIKRSIAPELALEWDNLEAHCSPCHCRATRAGE
jgi:5-methylcytosine-specific restriction protein A